MIQKLKKKFVLINMSLVALVLLIVFAVLMLFFYRQAADQAAATLSGRLSRSLNAPENKPEVGGKRGNAGGGQGRHFELPAFCVQLDPANNLVAKDVQNVTISDQVLSDAISRVLADGKGEGWIWEYGLQYAVRYSTVGTKIAFVDVASSRAGLQRQALLLLVCGLCGLLAFFFISLFLSDWALRPAALAWARQRQFVADASRELKAPLSAMLAGADTLLSRPEAAAQEERRWIENAKDEGTRLNGLIEDMLFLAEADASQPPPMETFNLSEVVLEAVTAFEVTARERGAALEHRISGDVRLYGNPAQIRRLTDILLENAVRSAGAGGRVRTVLAGDGATATLQVSNTGAPMDSADLPRVCGRFYGTESAGDRKSGESGLGLSVARSIARMHGGEIGVTSGGEGGAAFTVSWKGGRHGTV